MYPLGIDAPEDLVGEVRERLVEVLGAEGPVAVVTAADPASPPGRAETAYEVGPDGRWTATGTGADVPAVLETLAVDHDFAVIDAMRDVDVPRVVLDGARSSDGSTLAVDSVDDLDAKAVFGFLDAHDPVVTLESLVAEVKRSPAGDRAGAIATFTGRVRERDAPDDRPTEYLEFEKYEGLAEERMAELEAELEARDGVYRVRMHHRTGVIEAGVDIVFVVVLAGHRAEAFRTVEDGINRLKAEVPIFKKEVTADEAYWVHER